MISDRDDPLVISAELYHRHRLKEGIVLTRAQLEQLIAEADLDECEREIGRLLGLREHSTGEVCAKLTSKNHTPKAIESAVRKYIRNGLLDDARFAFNMARTTLERKPSGYSYLVALLRRKMVGRTLAEDTVNRLLQGRDETAIAIAALRHKRRYLDQFDVETARKKVYNYLSRRGIGYAAAKAAFEKLYGSDER